VEDIAALPGFTLKAAQSLKEWLMGEGLGTSGGNSI
jgi:hypothetical protein